MSRRCLIIACSRTKVAQPELLPAIERYDGPAFKVVRRYLRAATNETSELSRCLLDIFILSAEYGLISAATPIGFYDRQMTSARAKVVHSQVLSKIEQEMTSATFETVFVSMGQVYLEAIRGIDALLPKETQLIISTGSQGKKLTELKAWLWKKEASTKGRELAHEHPRPIANQQARPLVLRGQKVELTYNEALALGEGTHTWALAPLPSTRTAPRTIAAAGNAVRLGNRVGAAAISPPRLCRPL